MSTTYPRQFLSAGNLDCQICGRCIMAEEIGIEDQNGGISCMDHDIEARAEDERLSVELRDEEEAQRNRVLAFGGYRCGCTMLLDSDTVRSIPTLCPDHGKGLLGNPTMEVVEPGITLGLAPWSRPIA